MTTTRRAVVAALGLAGLPLAGVAKLLRAHATQAPLRYRVSRFEPPDGGVVASGALNANGLVVGTIHSGPGLTPRAFAWSSRMPSTWLAGADVASAAVGVDGFPNAVGWIGETPATPRPAMWRNLITGDPAIDLAPDESRGGMATAISANGDVLGVVMVRGSYLGEPVRFTAQAPRPLGTVDGSGFPAAVNASGVVVGYATSGIGEGSREFAVRWAPSEMEPLPTPADRSSYARAINDDGRIVGEIANSTGEGRFRATLWDGASVTELAMPEGYDSSTARGIDSTGAVVGTASSASGEQSIAVLWRDGAVVDLNEQVGGDADVSLREALAINRHSEILCTGWAGEERRSVGFLLTPE